MKSVTLGFLAAASFVIINTASGYSATVPAGFEQRKSEQIRRIDDRIKQLQDEKTCISAATSRDGMRTSHQQAKPAQKSSRS